MHFDDIRRGAYPHNPFSESQFHFVLTPLCRASLEFLHSPLSPLGERGRGVRGSMHSNHKRRNAVPRFLEKVLDVAWSLPNAFSGAT
jgi:hypothetical protein